MPSRNPAARLREILMEIAFVEDATKNMSFEAFRTDGTVRRAVERSYAIISEAAVKLGAQAEALAPGVPWGDIRGLGNVIRHAYGDIDHATLWEIRENDLDDLRQGCLQALDMLQH